MKSRLIVAAICVPLLFIVLFFLPPLFTGIVVAGISAMSCWELLTNIAPSLKKRLIIYPTVSAALIPLGVGFNLGVGVAPLVAALLLCVIFAEACLEYERDGLLPFSVIAEMLFAGALMPYFLSTVASLRVLENGRLYVLLPILIAFVADGGAYFAGVFMGKRHIFKKV
ncbi:MAG: phosphatidate cytidylyltransferase, partial [Oscillospiraceae bacterium]|nr:phosphatidate cytidylyltransferase [Oscillospiraceae bacterium]